jgi:hypothetical protein
MAAAILFDRKSNLRGGATSGVVAETAEEHDEEQEEEQKAVAVLFAPHTAVAEQHNKQQEKEKQAAVVVSDQTVEESAKDTGHRKTSFS